MKILIAENDPTSRTLLASILEKWGYAVIQAADGTDAWEILQGADAPRLALLDWMMPGVSGPDLCRRLRNEDRSETPYLILLTAREEAPDIAHGLEAGADDYIVKPYHSEALRARLNLGRRVLDLQAALRRTEDLQSALLSTRSICHDLNQPLQAASGYAELLMMNMPEDAPQYAALKRIIDSIDRIGGLMAKLVQVARSATLSSTNR